MLNSFGTWCLAYFSDHYPRCGCCCCRMVELRLMFPDRALCVVLCCISVLQVQKLLSVCGDHLAEDEATSLHQVG